MGFVVLMRTSFSVGLLDHVCISHCHTSGKHTCYLRRGGGGGGREGQGRLFFGVFVNAMIDFLKKIFFSEQ